MAGVTARIDVNVAATQKGTADMGVPHFDAAASWSKIFSEGTSTVDQTDLLFSDSRTIAASGTDDLDLRGTLVDALGNVLNFAEVTAIYVEALSTNTNNVVVGGAATNQFVGPFGAATHTVALQPGEVFVITSKNGWAVTAGTGDLLRIANSGAGTSVKYNIILVGRTVVA